jgi:hypothetical protein
MLVVKKWCMLTFCWYNVGFVFFFFNG